MQNYMMITYDAEEDRTVVTFCDIYPERDRGLAESQGLFVEIYRREFDSKMGMDNYVRWY